jgi:hypothetical protein
MPGVHPWNRPGVHPVDEKKSSGYNRQSRQFERPGGCLFFLPQLIFRLKGENEILF